MLIQHFVIFSFSLSVLVHAIGDASEITQNSTDKKLRMVEKETDCRLKHLQVNVERLKSILLTSDLGRLKKILAHHYCDFPHQHQTWTNGE